MSLTHPLYPLLFIHLVDQNSLKHEIPASVTLHEPISGNQRGGPHTSRHGVLKKDGQGALVIVVIVFKDAGVDKIMTDELDVFSGVGVADGCGRASGDQKFVASGIQLVVGECDVQGCIGERDKRKNRWVGCCQVRSCRSSVEHTSSLHGGFQIDLAERL